MSKRGWCPQRSLSHSSVASLSSIIIGVLESRLPGKTPSFYTPRDAINIRRITGRNQFGPDQSRGRYGGGNIGGSFGNAKGFAIGYFGGPGIWFPRTGAAAIWTRVELRVPVLYL